MKSTMYHVSPLRNMQSILTNGIESKLPQHIVGSRKQGNKRKVDAKLAGVFCVDYEHLEWAKNKVHNKEFTNGELVEKTKPNMKTGFNTINSDLVIIRFEVERDKLNRRPQAYQRGGRRITGEYFFITEDIGIADITGFSIVTQSEFSNL